MTIYVTRYFPYLGFNFSKLSTIMGLNIKDFTKLFSSLMIN